MKTTATDAHLDNMISGKRAKERRAVVGGAHNTDRTKAEPTRESRVNRRVAYVIKRIDKSTT
jgi:hypothetical protein